MKLGNPIGRLIDIQPTNPLGSACLTPFAHFCNRMSYDEKKTQPLFGGSITCELEKRFQDVSTIRQVPDHQEVFSDPNTDVSIIIELNEMDTTNTTGITDAAATAEYFFNDLAAANGCAAQDMEIVQTLDVTLPHFGQNCSSSGVIGSQKVAKFNSSEKDSILVYLYHIRLPQVTSDIILSLNVPHCTTVVPKTLATFSAFVKSFQIQNWALFG